MTDSDSQTRGTLDVPGAQLCYDVRGTGPILLLIPGGPADASTFAPIVPFLIEDFRVVTYDPRGLSRSSIDDSSRDVLVQIQAEDAHRLLQAVTDEPAYVFGNSGGAITGLTLVERYPEQVQALIAHEPPVIELLPNRDEVSATTEEIYQTYLAQGIWPAMMKFLTMAGITPGRPAERTDAEQEDARGSDAMAEMERNFRLFLGSMLREIVSYQPDIARLNAVSSRVLIGRGMTSPGQLAYRTASALAEQLGTATVSFPGGHGGYGEEPEAFAQVLRRVLLEG